MAKAISITSQSLYFMEIPIGHVTDQNTELLFVHFETRNFVPQTDIEPLPSCRPTHTLITTKIRSI